MGVGHVFEHVGQADHEWLGRQSDLLDGLFQRAVERGNAEQAQILDVALAGVDTEGVEPELLGGQQECAVSEPDIEPELPSLNPTWLMTFSTIFDDT